MANCKIHFQASLIKITFILALSAMFVGCSQADNKALTPEKGTVVIDWQDTLNGDFSFHEKWDYPEGVYKNEFNQLSCDGFCPPEIDRMKEANGKLMKDSMAAFYKLVDTTHLFHSINSDALCYEWAGTNYLTATKISKDTVLCFTSSNAATHSSLKLILTKSICIPSIELLSINRAMGNKLFYSKGGHMRVDKSFWDKGILKADFDFVFDNYSNPKEDMFWRGKIYSLIISL